MENHVNDDCGDQLKRSQSKWLRCVPSGVIRHGLSTAGIYADQIAAILLLTLCEIKPVERWLRWYLQQRAERLEKDK